MKSMTQLYEQIWNSFETLTSVGLTQARHNKATKRHLLTGSQALHYQHTNP